MIVRKMKFKSLIQATKSNIKGPAYRQTGDTIVEVIICISLISLVLAGAYTSSGHSLQNGTDASVRSQALNYAQSQIELIKNAANNPGLLNQYKRDPNTGGRPFCINPDGSPADASNNSSEWYYGLCQLPGKPYAVGITYDSAANKQLFTITAKWLAPNGSGQSNLQLYYRMPGAQVTS
jgi:type II secretory pathway pseudopilin PulG